MPKIKKIKEIGPKFRDVKEIHEEKVLEESVDNLPSFHSDDETEEPERGGGAVLRAAPVTRRESREDSVPTTRTEDKRDDNGSGWRSFYETTGSSPSEEEQDRKRIYEMGEQATNTTLRPRAQTRSIIQQAEERNLMQENRVPQNISRFNDEEDKKKYNAGEEQRKKGKERYWV